MENNETITERSEFDTKAFTDALLKQVKAAGGTKTFYKQHDIIKELTRATYQALLDAEMEEHLGYEKNDRESKETPNSRKGKGSKKIRCARTHQIGKCFRTMRRSSRSCS